MCSPKSKTDGKALHAFLKQHHLHHCHLHLSRPSYMHHQTPGQTITIGISPGWVTGVGNAKQGKMEALQRKRTQFTWKHCTVYMLLGCVQA